MKYSLNLGQYYSNLDLKKFPHDKLIAKAGAQLGGIDEVIDWAPKYEGVLVVKVISVEDHPDADRLHVCMVDDGGKAKSVKRDSKGLVQVVCGAPNVRAGMFVAWLPPGSTVPSTSGGSEPFVLEARELRGVVSNGMLASAKELGIGEDHDGILEIIPEEVASDKARKVSTIKPGESFVQYFGLDDFVMDFENKMFTHRPDCFGNLGISRELAGILGLSFKSPDWYLQEPDFEEKSAIKLHVNNEVTKLVPRFMAVAMSNVTVGKSPVWLQAALSRVGIKSINNVVDVTNYVMHITGQPLHAFDSDKLASNTLGPRMAKKGEKIALLNGKTIELNEDDIVIATDSRAVALAGVMGGSETEVDNNTKNIVIEAATFDMYTVRRTSMRHGLFTDASTRYTKGQSPLQNPRAIYYAMENMQRLTGAEQASNVYDAHGKLEESTSVTVNAQFINERLGTKLSLKDITKLLENVEFKIVTAPADKTRLHVRPPFWRTDIDLPEDVVEEIGRLYGYDNAPMTLPPRSARAATENPELSLKMQLRYRLKEAGASEVLTYSFVHAKLMEKVGQDPSLAFHLRNAVSPDLQYYRLSVLPSLLDKVRGNIRADLIQDDDNEFALYEIGKAHSNTEMDEDGIPKEFDRVAFTFTADEKTATRKYSGAPYFMAQKYFIWVLGDTSFELFPMKEADTKGHKLLTQMLAPFEPTRSAIVRKGDRIVGVVGEYKDEVRRAFKLPEYSAGFELFMSDIEGAATTGYTVLSQFPKIQQDVTFEVSAGTNFSKLEASIKAILQNTTDDHGYQATMLPRDIFQAEGTDKKRLTFRIWLSHPSRTLTIEETNRVLDEMTVELKEKLSAERI